MDGKNLSYSLDVIESRGGFPKWGPIHNVGRGYYLDSVKISNTPLYEPNNLFPMWKERERKSLNIQQRLKKC
jgi:hypothetical protein